MSEPPPIPPSPLPFPCPACGDGEGMGDLRLSVGTLKDTLASRCKSDRYHGAA